jgi:hypothetical protein
MENLDYCLPYPPLGESPDGDRHWKRKIMIEL